MTNVTVVVPTYNRGEALGVMLDRLLVSDRQGLGEVEIVVVDDGSSAAASSIVDARQAPPGITLKCIRQENGGPAAARNMGFKTSHGDIVIFIDDDILVPPELIRQHVEAHELNPGAVIFGMCKPQTSGRAHIDEVLGLIGGTRSNTSRFERKSIISSQHLSVERRNFPICVYDSNLKTPAAEEFELSARLRHEGIAIFNATQIGAENDQALAVSYLCEQQYKHAMGCAEALCKLPDSMVMDELATIEAANRPARQHDRMATKCKKVAKTIIATRPVRRALLSLCELTGRIVPSHTINAKLLLFVIGIYFFAGYREGQRRFGPTAVSE